MSNYLESYHTFEKIEERIRWYVAELTQRYTLFADSEISEKDWRRNLWDNGQAIALICDECTTYGDFIKDEELLAQFARLAVTKSRKQEMPVSFAAHNNTQTCLFGIKGLSNLVQKMLQVEFLATVDLNKSSQPKASGKARLKLDSSREWHSVDVPEMQGKITRFYEVYPVEPVVKTPPASTTPPPALHLDLHQLEALMHQDSTSFHPIPEGWQFPNPMQPLTPEIRAVVVACKRSGLSQNAAILAVWGLIKSGSDKRYEAARNHYQSVSI